MGKYTLTYESDSAHPKKQLWFYGVRFKSKDGKEEFVLKPNAFVNYKGNEGLMANPDAKHYWDHDVFTYITSLPNPNRQEDTASLPNKLKAGDSLFYSSGYMVLQSVKQRDSLPDEIFGKDGKLFEAPIRVFSKTGSVFSVTSRLAFVKDGILALPDTITSEGLILQLQQVNKTGKVNSSIVNTRFSNLNIRKGPGTKYMIIGKSHKNEIVTTVNRINKYWWLIRNKNGKQGYSNAKYLKEIPYNVLPEVTEIELAVKETNSVTKFVTLKAYKFPFILLLWIGVIITALGITISMVRRIQLNRSSISQS
jgi:SH3-like domain-containing protein